MPWSQVLPSLCCVLPSEGAAGCLVANPSGRAWLTPCPVPPEQSPLVKYGIPPLNTVLGSSHSTLADLLPIYLGFMVGSPHVLPSYGPFENLYFFFRILYLIFPVSDHLPQHSAHSRAEAGPLQCNPPRQKGPSVAGMLFWCCLSVYRLLLSCPGSVSP